ncbi:Coenzyme F420 hydrogenase/dehydrogenase, beta subunit C-terminal domain [Candidatus Bathyarchaeota archaeon]|nr:Coenzyme F420 hydrogenase/dehydrogenase, beta subunit C-terminal domain [Candidatus Bathyarchaeota archaeon]
MASRCPTCVACGGCAPKSKPDLEKIREEVGIKSFYNLKEEVIEKNLCSMCRGCVTFCSASTLEAIAILKGKPDYINEKNCLSCGICYAICPRTSSLENSLRERYNYSLPIGSYKSIYSLRSKDLQIQEVATDGGFVTGFLKYLMDEKIIDGALISRREGLMNNQPMLAMSFKYLLKGAGSSLAVSSSLEDLNIYTTYIPSLLMLKGLGEFPTRIAVVGTPCQITTIRKMQLLKIVPSNIVNFTVGLFCYENFHFTEDGRKFLEEKINARMSDIEKINVKESMIVKLSNGKRIEIDLDELHRIVRPECLPCLDFANWTSDVSVGGLGSQDGYTTVLARTNQGKSFVDRSIERGYFEEDHMFDKNEALEKIKSMAIKKRTRGLKRLEELGLDSKEFE